MREATHLLEANELTRYATISAVSRTVQTLEALAASPKGVAVSALAERLSIEVSIASRILATLAAEGYARREPHGEYTLTHKLLATSSRFAEEVGFIDLCTPLLREVADKTGELVQLALLESATLWFVAKAEGKHRIRMLSALGRRAPVHATSVGKAWLATLPAEEALRIAAADGLKRFTKHTITSVARLRAELRKVRVQGYGVVEDEYLEGSTAVGAAIRLQRLGGRVVGAVSVAAPSFRVTPDHVSTFGREMVRLAERVTSVWPPGADLPDVQRSGS